MKSVRVMCVFFDWVDVELGFLCGYFRELVVVAFREICEHGFVLFLVGADSLV